MTAPIQIVRILFVALFVGGLALPAILTDYGSEMPQTADMLAEVEVTTKVPLTPGWLQDRLRELDAARRKFSSTFWGRDTLMRAIGHWKLAGFDSARWNRHTMRGRDGWLFLQNHLPDDPIGLFRGTTTFSDNEIADLTSRLVAWRDWFAERGMDFLILVTPNKITIYPEHAPDWLSPQSSMLRTRLVEAWRAAGLEVVDLAPALLAAREGGQLYHRTDTHWNARGAFAGYRELLQHSWFAERGIQPLTHDDFRESVYESTGGDLTRPLEKHPLLVEQVVQYERVQPDLAPYRMTPHRYDHTTHVHNPSLGQEAPRVYTINDSYMHGLEPFLFHHFRELMSWWTFRYQIPHQEIELEQPDLVILQVLERFLPVLMELPPPPSN